MKDQTSLRKYLLEQKEYESFKPSDNFIMNFEKVLNNQIEIKKLKVKSKKSKEEKSSKPNFLHSFFYKPAYAFALTLVLIMGITFGVFTYINLNKKNIVDQKITAAEVLASVYKNVNEIKSGSETLNYKIIYHDFEFGVYPDSISYCNKWINYENKIQRNECGLKLTEEIPVEQGILTGEQINQYPEISPEFYENILKIKFNNALIISEDQSTYTLQSVWNLEDGAKGYYLKEYEQKNNLNANSTIITFVITKQNRQVLSANLTYGFTNGREIKAYSYEILEINKLKYDPIQFVESTGEVHKMVEADLTAKIQTNGVLNFKFNARKDNNYLVLKTDTETTLLQNFKNITKDQVLTFDAEIKDGSLNFVMVKPYKIINNQYVFSDGIESHFYQKIPDNIENLQLDNIIRFDESLGNVIYNYGQGLTHIAPSSNATNSKNFENSRVSLKIPAGWTVQETSCFEGECSALTIRKGDYELSISTNVAPSPVGYGNYGDICFDSKKQIRERLSDKLDRIDEFIYLNPSSQDSTCSMIKVSKPNTNYWLNSMIVVKDENGTFIETSKLFGTTFTPKNEDDNDWILIMYDYMPEKGLDYENGAIMPESNNPEHLKMLKEMDEIVKTITFKK